MSRFGKFYLRGQALLVPILAATFLLSAAIPQPVVSQGIEFPEPATNFLLCFLAHSPSDNGLQYIYISSLDDSANIIITCREYPKFDMAFSLLPRSDTIISIFGGSFDIINDESETITKKVVRVRSSSPIVCIGDNGYTNQREQFVAISEENAGTNFRVLAYADALFINHNQFPLVPHIAVAAFYTFTQVTIIPTENTLNGSSKGIPLTFTLDSGECVYLRSEYVQKNGKDLTGTKITSTKPVAVFAGHPQTEVPTAYSLNPHISSFIIESIPSTGSLGKGYIFRYSNSRERSDPDSNFYPGAGKELLRVLAVTNNTQVRIDGKPWGLQLAEGEYKDTLIMGPLLIEADQPILVGNFSHSSYYAADSMPGAPFLAVLPSLESRSIDQTFYVRPDTMFYEFHPEPFFQAQYVQIVVERSNKSNVRMDGMLIPDSIFTDVEGSFGGYEFSVGSVRTSPGRQHRLSVPGKNENGFVFLVHGAAGMRETSGAVSAYAYGSQMLYRKLDLLEVDDPSSDQQSTNFEGFSSSLYRQSPQAVVLRLNNLEPGESEVDLYDVMGRLIAKKIVYISSTTEDIFITVSNLSSGIYLCRVLNSGKYYVHKMMLQQFK